MDNFIVGFSKPKHWKPFAWLIMKGYGIPYSHTYIKFWSSKYERWLIYQASKTLVNFMSENVFLNENLVVKEFPINIDTINKDRAIQFAIDNAGKSYGILNALGLIIVKIFWVFGKQIKNPLSDDNKTYICCELVSDILKDFVGLDIPYESNSIDPKELYEFMIKTQNRFF